MQDAENLELDYTSGMLKTVDGLYPLVKMPSKIDTLFYNYTANYFIASCGKNLYRLSGSLSPISFPNLIGTLSNVSRPVYDVWDSEILIASGDRMQVYDGATLTTIKSMPCDNLFVRSGRVVTSMTGTDTLYYCGVNDYTNWIMDTDNLMNGLYIEIGNKDGGGIVSVSNLAGNIIVIKKNGKAFRLAGDYETWAEYELGNNIHCMSNAASINTGNGVFFIGKDGFKVLNTSAEYGTVKSQEAGAPINQVLLKGVSESARLWDVSPKKQIWIRAADDNKIYLYHYFKTICSNCSRILRNSRQLLKRLLPQR